MSATGTDTSSFPCIRRDKTVSCTVMRKPVWSVVLFVLILAQGCGYHLRGHSPGVGRAASAYSVFIKAEAGPIADALKARLQIAGVDISERRKDADFALSLYGTAFERQVASVSPDTGKVEEYLVVFTTRISISKADGEDLVTGRLIRVSGDYAFDEDAALGKFAEEEIIREELIEQAATQIAGRLNTLAE